MSKKKVASSLIRGIEKVNPLDKPVNKSDTSNSGIESAKLGYRTIKKGKKTAKKTVKAGKLIYNAPVKTVKTVIWTVKAATSVVVHTAAMMMNPVFWVIVAVLFIVVTWILPTILLLTGGASGATTINKAYGNAAGVNEKIANVFPQAVEFYNTASENKQNEFNSFIDSLYYDVDDLPNSDLVYMECSKDGSVYQTSMATDYRKQQLKDKFSKSLSKEEAIALVYINLEKQKNADNGTEGEIYEVEFTQEAFDNLLNMMVSWTDTVYAGRECPQANCSVHIEEKPNPDYDELSQLVNTAASAYNDWGGVCVKLERWNSIQNGTAQTQYWNNTVQPAINKWLSDYAEFEQYHVPVWYYDYYSSNGYGYLDVLGGIYEECSERLDNTPETITVRTVNCDHLHNLHAIGLNVVSKDDVMTAWNFTEIDKEWYEITYKGFQLNPDIQTD